MVKISCYLYASSDIF